MKTDKLRRLTAASLVLAFTLPQAAQAAEPTVETDESVYINMDYYGAPTNTRIVKGVSLNGHTEFTDFGSYADVASELRIILNESFFPIRIAFT